MCGRFTLRTSSRDLVEIFQLLREPDLTPRYNIAPTQPVAVIRQVDGHRELSMMRWGLVPAWSKDPKSGPRSAAPLQHYNEVSRKLEDEQHTLNRMRTWRIASPSSNPLTQDADQRSEQRQRDLVLRLVKERDALAAQLVIL
jgi:hypothetical protein